MSWWTWPLCLSESRSPPCSAKVLSLSGAQDPCLLPSLPPIFPAKKSYVLAPTDALAPEPRRGLAGREAFIKPSGRGRAEDREAQVFMSRPTGPRNPSPLAGSPRPFSIPTGLIRPGPRLKGVLACKIAGLQQGQAGQEEERGDP